MGEVVVAVLNRPDDAEALLDAGAFLLDIGGGGGRLEALAVRMPPMATIVPSEQVLTASREAEIRAEQEAWAGELRKVVEGWMARAQHPGIRTDWLDVEGNASEVIDDHGRRADAIVIARPTSQDSQHMRACMHAALFESDRPVLVIPPGLRGSWDRLRPSRGRMTSARSKLCAPVFRSCARPGACTSFAPIVPRRCPRCWRNTIFRQSCTRCRTAMARPPSGSCTRRIGLGLICW